MADEKSGNGKPVGTIERVTTELKEDAVPQD